MSPTCQGSPRKPEWTRPAGAPKLLVVDDDEYWRVYAGELLRRMGWTAVPASGGAQALALLPGLQVDGVLSDIEMPDMDGLQLVQALRADARWVALPVMLMTSLPPSSSPVTVGKAWADVVLRKPLEVPALEQALRAIAARFPVRTERPSKV